VDELRVPADQTDDIVVLVVRVTLEPEMLDLVFRARAEELGTMRAAVRSWFDNWKIDTDVRDAVVLALGEACANAVEHAYVDAPEGDIQLVIFMTGKALSVEVRDFGTWRTTAHGDPDRGRGYQIMRALSDQVDVVPGANGTTVTMRFAGGTE
jgi:anti-sigma regulatory factor (Ser/Thr protein kinase)